ncbi:MAG: PH domain-containing protein [Patescibacteria group bacterium]
MLKTHFYLPHPAADEKVELIIRRHSLIFFWNSLAFVGLLIFGWAIRIFFLNQYPALMGAPTVAALITLLASVYGLSIILFWYAAFLDYWLDVWIVTTNRIISVEQKGLFARTFAEQQRYQLQDVSAKVTGFFPTMFRYGDVLVQVAGSVQNATLKQVPHADQLARRIMELAEAVKRKHPIMP